MTSMEVTASGTMMDCQRLLQLHCVTLKSCPQLPQVHMMSQIQVLILKSSHVNIPHVLLGPSHIRWCVTARFAKPFSFDVHNICGRSTVGFSLQTQSGLRNALKCICMSSKCAMALPIASTLGMCMSTCHVMACSAACRICSPYYP